MESFLFCSYVTRPGMNPRFLFGSLTCWELQDMIENQHLLQSRPNLSSLMTKRTTTPTTPTPSKSSLTASTPHLQEQGSPAASMRPHPLHRPHSSQHPPPWLPQRTPTKNTWPSNAVCWGARKSWLKRL
ncbi:uncharacterized protein LOC144761369 [Lissotriton helveticus]